MKTVSILLNLTGCLSFEETDPMMALVAGKGTLLFYDQLSVRRFPSEKDKYDNYLDGLLSNLRNLLESRALSREDGGERIRLIVTIDLAGGLFEPQDKGCKRFPAQKVRAFRQCLKSVFGEGNPLLRRISYSFIFLESTLPDDKPLSTFYRTFGIDGFTGEGDWLSAGDLTVEEIRKSILARIQDANDDLTIDDPSVARYISEFGKHLDNLIERAAGFLDQLDLGDLFRHNVKKRLSSVRSVKDVNSLDYDNLLQSTVSDLIGLSSREFQKDCSFFLMKYSTTPVAVKRKDELTLISLILLLITLSDDDYKDLLQRGSSPSILILGAVDEDNVNRELLVRLRQVALACRNKLREGGDLRKKKDSRVTYTVYDSQAHTISESDSFAPLNYKRNEERRKLQDDFKKVRRIPFFFGTKPGDWDWYKQVVSATDALYQFERLNGRPLHDSARRITEKEMTHSSAECSYTELEHRIAELSRQETQIAHTEDLTLYFGERKNLMLRFNNACGKMKKEMVKLGYFYNMAWISLFLSLAFALCYTFHFIYSGSDGCLLWFGAALAVSLACFFIGALVSRLSLKHKIEDTYREIDSCCLQMSTKMSNFLQQVNNRIEAQKQADLRRRNLEEMQDKIEEFNRHNLQVDRWETYFDGLLTRIEDTMDLLQIPYAPEESIPIKVSPSDFPLDDFPSVPDALCEEFHEASTELSCFNRLLTNVTCFINRFECTKL